MKRTLKIDKKNVKIVEIFSNYGIVSIQWLTKDVGIIRYHGKESGYGSLFSFSVTMVAKQDKAEFYAAFGTYTKKIHKAIGDAMKSIGINIVNYERRNTPKIRYKTLTK